MKILVSEKLSDHKFKTQEGYLICKDAVLARTGKQEYTRGELGFTDSRNERIMVDRKPEQVFDERTLASFENKPITVEHPDVDVNAENYKDYAVGFVRDVHRGTDNGQDVILGNLVITDAKTIEEIENGEHTDLSCGYDCDINDSDGAYCQENIRGNHVALCAQGRAGIARIVDSINVDDTWPSVPVNGDLASYDVNRLISAVKSRKEAVHANLLNKSKDKLYKVVIDADFGADLGKGEGVTLIITSTEKGGAQKRHLDKDFGSWDALKREFDSFRRGVRDSVNVDETPEEEPKAEEPIKPDLKEKRRADAIKIISAINRIKGRKR